MFHGVSTKQFFRDLNQEISDDNVFNGAAALGFYLTLAIFPAIILLMTIIPYLPIADVDKAIMDLLGQALPSEAFGMVEGVVAEANRRPARRLTVVQSTRDVVGRILGDGRNHGSAEHHL